MNAILLVVVAKKTVPDQNSSWLEMAEKIAKEMRDLLNRVTPTPAQACVILCLQLSHFGKNDFHFKNIIASIIYNPYYRV